jgi:Rrf2 family transcriptional regulator, nitric oxide-sensitive transcriptional repressor
MQFSQTVEYALRAAVWLAGREGLPQTTAQIAEATQMPASYLSKVLQLLARAGLVSSQRGVGGGFTLARPGSEVTVLQIVEAVEPLQRIRTCPLGIQEHGIALCPLHSKLDQALESIEASFGSTRLADLVAPGASLHPLCPPASSGDPE